MMWLCHNDCGLGNLVGTTLLNRGAADSQHLQLVVSPWIDAAVDAAVFD